MNSEFMMYTRYHTYNLALTRQRRSSLKQAKSLFDSWAKDGNALQPNLRSVAYRAGIKLSPEDAVAAIKKEWYSGTAVDGKEVSLAALAQVDDEAIISKLLPFLFDSSPPAAASESVPSADMHTLGGGLAANGTARPLLWKYMQENWKQLETKMANPVVIDRFLKLSLNKFTDVKYVDEVDKFFADKDTSAYNRTLEQIKDAIRGRAAYRERDSAVIKEWLKAHGYLQ